MKNTINIALIFFIIFLIFIFLPYGNKKREITRFTNKKKPLALKDISHTPQEKNNHNSKNNIISKNISDVNISSLSDIKIDDFIKEIDEDIEKNDYIFRANNDSLSLKERAIFKNMLSRRNSFFKEKAKRIIEKLDQSTSL